MSDVGLFLLLFAALALMIGVIRFFAWLTDFFEAGGIRAALERSADRYVSVKRYEGSDTNIMSRVPSDAAPSVPSSLRQTEHQTQDQTEDPIVRRAKLLDTYRALRKAGLNRDDARALLKPWGIPVDNNLWAQAAPQEEETHITPIVGRRTNAQFETDPELAYQSPPR